MRNRMRVFLLLLLLAVSPVTFATGVDESLLQMLYLRNFIDYTTWPDQRRPRVLTLMDASGLKPAITAMQRQHAFAIPTIRYCTTIDCAKASDILFISRRYQNSAALLAALEGSHTLTVSSQPGFIDRGGMIGMVRRNRRLQFEVNLRAVKAARLHISAELLQMASRVIGNDTP